MKLIITAMVICSSVWAKAFCLPTPVQSDVKNPVAFFETFVESLTHSKILIVARRGGSASQAIAFRNSMLQQAKDLDCARRQIEPFKNSPDRIISSASERAATAYDELAKTVTLIVEASDQQSGKKKPGKVGLVPDLNDLQMLMESNWDLLMKASAAATVTVLEPATDEGKAHLRITDQLRRELLKKLVSTFGNDIVEGLKVGRTKSTASPAIVAGFLASNEFLSENEGRRDSHWARERVSRLPKPVASRRTLQLPLS